MARGDRGGAEIRRGGLGWGVATSPLRSPAVRDGAMPTMNVITVISTDANVSARRRVRSHLPSRRQPHTVPRHWRGRRGPAAVLGQGGVFWVKMGLAHCGTDSSDGNFDRRFRSRRPPHAAAPPAPIARRQLRTLAWDIPQVFCSTVLPLCTVSCCNSTSGTSYAPEQVRAEARPVWACLERQCCMIRMGVGDQRCPRVSCALPLARNGANGA